MNIQVKKRNGRLESFNVEKINKCAERACIGIKDVSASEILLDAQLQLFNKITTSEIDQALIFSARDKIYKEPNYSYAAARILLNCLYKEVFKEGADSDILELQYRKSFVQNIKQLVLDNRLSEKMLGFDLKMLSEALVIDRDNDFKYLGIKTLHDRYFIRSEEKIMESPQGFWMRVAMGLSLNEKDKNEKAIEFYNLMSRFLYTPSTPTLFNSGSKRSQLSSCYLNTFDDSIDGIFDGAWQEARKSKYAGGLGLDVTPFRATGSHIEGTNGISSGLVPWLKIFNDLLIAVNQGGKRPGAGCAYLEPWHLDFEDFLNLRRNTGDERLRCHDMNTAAWIPDEFMRRVKNEKEWYFFDPKEMKYEEGKTLHDYFGQEFDDKYNELCKAAEEGLVKNFRKTPAKDLWKKMLKVLFETSHPWNTFKDPCNIRYTNQHQGTVHSSNLCTEITLHTKSSKYEKGEKTEIGETAVCNLGSINLLNHLREHVNEKGKSAFDLNWTKLAETTQTALRMLDNVIDLNFYPTREAEKSNLKHRPVGLGMMGLHDILHKMNIMIDSDEAVSFSDKLFESYSKNAIFSSSKLAAERGSYNTYSGSLWDQGEFPIDSYNHLMEYRDKPKSSETISEWEEVRASVKKYGMRNSNVMAIAPTATIGYINGVEQSIEPNFSTLFVYENKSGNFYIINEHFVQDMKKINLWNKEMADLIKSVDGDLSFLGKEVPEEIKQKYKTVFDRDMFKLIEANAARQKWMDQSISFNLYNKGTSLKYLNDIYMSCWEYGLKTTYYLRNKAATKVEKSTDSNDEKQEDSETESCSIEAARNGEICESCQ